jgi:hypothetical protein
MVRRHPLWFLWLALVVGCTGDAEPAGVNDTQQDLGGGAGRLDVAQDDIDTPDVMLADAPRLDDTPELATSDQTGSDSPDSEVQAETVVPDAQQDALADVVECVKPTSHPSCPNQCDPEMDLIWCGSDNVSCTCRDRYCGGEVAYSYTAGEECSPGAPCSEGHCGGTSDAGP